MRIKMVDKMSGVELAQFESEVPRVGETLYLTAHALGGTIARCGEVAHAAFTTRAATMQAVLAVLDDWIASAKDRDQRTADVLQAARNAIAVTPPPLAMTPQPQGVPLLRCTTREDLGRQVRQEWIAWAKEQPNPKPSWLAPWDELSEPEREVDRRIGERLAAVGARVAWADVESWLERIPWHAPPVLKATSLRFTPTSTRRMFDDGIMVEAMVDDVAVRLPHIRDVKIEHGPAARDPSATIEFAAIRIGR